VKEKEEMEEEEEGDAGKHGDESSGVEFDHVLGASRCFYLRGGGGGE
jgi:hypothetical protein